MNELPIPKNVSNEFLTLFNKNSELRNVPKEYLSHEEQDSLLQVTAQLIQLSCDSSVSIDTKRDLFCEIWPDYRIDKSEREELKSRISLSKIHQDPTDPNSLNRLTNKFLIAEGLNELFNSFQNIEYTDFRLLQLLMIASRKHDFYYDNHYQPGQADEFAINIFHSTKKVLPYYLEQEHFCKLSNEEKEDLLYCILQLSHANLYTDDNTKITEDPLLEECCQKLEKISIDEFININSKCEYIMLIKDKDLKIDSLRTVLSKNEFYSNSITTYKLKILEMGANELPKDDERLRALKCYVHTIGNWEDISIVLSKTAEEDWLLVYDIVNEKISVDLAKEMGERGEKALLISCNNDANKLEKLLNTDDYKVEAQDPFGKKVLFEITQSRLC